MIQNNQSGAELTGAELGCNTRLDIRPFQSVNLRTGLRALDPGLLMAGAAAGTSPLVQSIRAFLRLPKLSPDLFHPCAGGAAARPHHANAKQGGTGLFCVCGLCLSAVSRDGDHFIT